MDGKAKIEHLTPNVFYNDTRLLDVEAYPTDKFNVVDQGREAPIILWFIYKHY